MAFQEQMDLLKKGAEGWNEWRVENADVEIELSGANLSEANLTAADLRGANLSRAHLIEANLSGADLSGATLRGAKLIRANLSGAVLTEANLRRANLSEANLTAAALREADLRGADLRGANLTRANLHEADLSRADLTAADLSRANLNGANLRGADLRGADLSGADLSGARLSRADLTDTKMLDVIYARTDFRDMYHATIVESCRGNPIFKRDVEDQQYIEAVQRSLRQQRGGRFLFWLWGLTDYGRSLVRVAIGAGFLSFIFGSIFWVGRWQNWGLLCYEESADTVITPFYYSIVTYTTLGFGDVVPANWVGELLVIIEVVFGYLTLGLLLAILANTVARRS